MHVMNKHVLIHMRHGIIVLTLHGSAIQRVLRDIELRVVTIMVKDRVAMLKLNVEVREDLI